MAPVSTHRLSAGDLPAMRELNALFAAVFDDPASYASELPRDEYLSAVLAKPHIIVLVARDGQKVVGGLVAYAFDKLEKARSEIYIYDLAVAETHRRQGIATTLIAELGRLAEEQGAWVIFVQADHGDDPAMALYTKLGRREDVMHFDIDVPAAGPGKADET
jgi:aminoglycoside 3-N-acetyltransferase I